MGRPHESVVNRLITVDADRYEVVRLCRTLMPAQVARVSVRGEHLLPCTSVWPARAMPGYRHKRTPPCVAGTGFEPVSTEHEPVEATAPLTRAA